MTTATPTFCRSVQRAAAAVSAAATVTADPTGFRVVDTGMHERSVVATDPQSRTILDERDRFERWIAQQPPIEDRSERPRVLRRRAAPADRT